MSKELNALENIKNDITKLYGRIPLFEKLNIETIEKALLEFKRLDLLLRLPSKQSSSHFTYKNKDLVCIQLTEYNNLMNAFLKLELIKKTNPSEALECLEMIMNTLTDRTKSMLQNAWFDRCYQTIKATLLKAQEQEKENIKLKGQVKYLTEVATEFQKVLEIIFKKGLSLAERDIIKQSENYEQYQIKISWWNYKPFAIPKSKEEFELLKRYCDEQNN